MGGVQTNLLEEKSKVWAIAPSGVPSSHVWFYPDRLPRFYGRLQLQSCRWDAVKFEPVIAVPIPINRNAVKIGAIQTTLLEKKYKVWAFVVSFSGASRAGVPSGV
ncbi:MAG: hypothetical protein WCJ71_01300 [Candidatus Omnitrophota bacterium]